MFLALHMADDSLNPHGAELECRLLLHGMHLACSGLATDASQPRKRTSSSQLTLNLHLPIVAD